MNAKGMVRVYQYWKATDSTLSPSVLQYSMRALGVRKGLSSPHFVSRINANHSQSSLTTDILHYRLNCCHWVVFKRIAWKRSPSWFWWVSPLIAVCYHSTEAQGNKMNWLIGKRVRERAKEWKVILTFFWSTPKKSLRYSKDVTLKHPSCFTDLDLLDSSSKFPFLLSSPHVDILCCQLRDVEILSYWDFIQLISENKDFVKQELC